MMDQGIKEAYDRMTRQEVELARHIRDTINKTDDTRAVYKLLVDMLQAYESRVLLDSGEGRHASGERYTPEDFWTNVGEVRGLRWLQSRVKSMISKAETADEADRKRRESRNIPS